MAAKYLGPAFDIHGGGVDLRFPHHENELAQSRAAGQAFASYWLHNAWITTAGEKMSKSLGNSLLVPEVLKRVPADRAALLHGLRRTTARTSSSPFEALDEAAAALPADRELPRSERAELRRATAAGRPAAADVRRGDGRRPRYAGRHRGDPRRRARGQHAARGRRPGDAATSARRRARDARRARARPADPAWGAAAAPTTSSRAAVDALVGACSRSGPPHEPTRTGPPPTRSATGSRPPASRSRTPPTARSGPTDRRAGRLMAGNAKRKGAIRKSARATDRRLGRAGPPGARGQGPDPEGRDRPPQPQGPQGAEGAADATSTARGAHGRTAQAGDGRVDRRAQPVRRGAAGGRAGQRGVRRRGHRARRAAARGVQARGRGRHLAARGDPGRARPAYRRAVHQGWRCGSRPTSTPTPTTC